MKPNAIKKKVGTLKYYLDQTISSSPTDFTDEQVSEIILKYFTGLESSPNAKGKKYIKGARKTVTLTDGKTPTTLSLSTGASFKVSTNGDTITFTSDPAPAKGDAAGVTSQFVHTITTTDGSTVHSFTQTRMVGDKPISQETFTVDLPQGATFSKDNLPNIYVADSSYSQVDPLAPRIATPVQNKPVAVVPVVPTALVPVEAADDEEQVLTNIPGNIPLEHFLNGGQTIDQRLASRLRPTITPIVDNTRINQGDTHMADTPRREEQGFNIVDESGNIVRRGTRTNELHFDSLDDWAATCREIEQINRARAEAGQPPIEYPTFRTQDDAGNPVTHTYVESNGQDQHGIIPAGGQRRERSQTQGGGLILRPTNPVGRREEVIDAEFVDTDPVVRPREEGDDTVHIVEEDSEEIRLWRQRCAAIDEENRLRETQGKKPKKYPRKPKAQVHKKGKKAVKSPTKLKKVLQVVGKVAIVVAVVVVLVVTAVVGKKHYDKYIAEPETSIVETDNKINDEYLPEVGEVESVTPEEDATLTPPPSGEVDTDVEEDEVVINPVVPEGEEGNPLKNPTGGVKNFGPEDDAEDEEFDLEEATGTAKGLTDTSGTQTDFGKAAGKGQNKGAPANTQEDTQELGGQ